MTSVNRKGFTLVELAIVMVIIGILIGGILKGQELIGNARTGKTISVIKSADAAIHGFVDKYNAFPGDLANPQARLPNCTDPLCNTAGDGNGRLNNPPAGNTSNTEGGRMFPQLAAAGLVSGIDITRGHIWGGTFPATGFPDNGLTPGFSPNGAPGEFGNELIDATGMRPGHYFNLHGCTPAGGCETVNSSYTAMIDSKLDDGNPARGLVRAKITQGDLACATAGAAGAYIPARQCGLFIKLSQ